MNICFSHECPFKQDENELIKPNLNLSPLRVFVYQKQAVAELGHTRIPSCQLGQCSIQVKLNRVGGHWLVTRDGDFLSLGIVFRIY